MTKLRDEYTLWKWLLLGSKTVIIPSTLQNTDDKDMQNNNIAR
jgi:hypothetical protein